MKQQHLVIVSGWRETVRREVSEQGRTIRWLAKKTSINRQTLYKLLEGDPRSAVRPEMLHRIALALGKDAAWLFAEGEAAPIHRGRVAHVNEADGAAVAGETPMHRGGATSADGEAARCACGEAGEGVERR